MSNDKKEFDDREKEQVAKTITAMYLFGIFFFAFLTLVITRHATIWDVSWYNWEWDDWAAFVVFWLFLTSILNMCRLISIRKTISWLQKGGSFFPWRVGRPKKEKREKKKEEGKSGLGDNDGKADPPEWPDLST